MMSFLRRLMWWLRPQRNRAVSIFAITREIGIRMALGARRTAVIWMVLREVCVLTVLGLASSIPLVRGTSPFVTSFLFEMQPNDPRAIRAKRSDD